MTKSIPEETIRLSREVASILEIILDDPTPSLKKQELLLAAVGKLADIIVLNQ